MRTAMIVPIICALGLAVPSAARAQAPPSLTNGPADSGAAQAPAAPQASTPAPAPGLDESRSLFEQTWRQFQLGGRFTERRRRPGAVSALPGPPQTACFSPTRATGRKIPAATGSTTLAADNVGYRDQRYFGELRAHRQGPRSPACGTRSRSSTAWTPRRRTHDRQSRCSSTTRRSARSRTAGEPVGLRADRAAVRSHGAARHRQRST